MNRLLVLCCLLLTLRAFAAFPAAGPALDAVPQRPTATAGLPAPATWPLARYAHQPRMLVISGGYVATGGYQRVARRLHATLDARYLPSDALMQFHVNDKWIEPTDNPTLAEVEAAWRKAAIDAVGAGTPYEVIFCDNPDNLLWDAPMQAKVQAYLEAGGVLVICGNNYPPADSALAKIWPATASPNAAWMTGGAQREPGTELTGVPTRLLAGHNYAAVPQAAPGARALATGASGAAFLRTVGKGTLIFCPMGPISKKADGIALFSRLFDQDDIWLRYWDQLLYTLLQANSIPAYTDLTLGAATAPPGQDYVLPATLNTEKWGGGALALSVHVVSPLGKVVYAKEWTTGGKVDGNGTNASAVQKLDVRIPVASDWPAGMYPVYLTVGDPRKKVQYQQSLEYLPVGGTLTLAMTTDKPGYKVGQTATCTLTATSTAPWAGKLLFGVYDFRGRLLGSGEKAAQLTGTAQTITFTYRMADNGTRDSTLWAQVAAVKDGREWGRAEAKIYNYEPWNMRKEYQWSTWAGFAVGPPSTTPQGMTLMAHAGMNALGYPGNSELFYPAERWGWRYYNEGLVMNTFQPVIEYENDAEIETMLLDQLGASNKIPDYISAAFVFGSVGEEAGFKYGWGTHYYWETPEAPDKACHALQWYLKTIYPDIAALNTAWHTNYQALSEIKLTKEFSGAAPSLDADGWSHPKASPLGAGVTAVSMVPYQDTTNFYNWYYDKIVTAARRIFRERINPVTLAMSSAPTIGSGQYDVRIAGPGLWNESQTHSTYVDGPEPGFALVWGHFDWHVQTDNLFWGYLLTRTGHNDYWVGVPLMFNRDLTHTRSTFALREWTNRLAGHERIILDSVPETSQVGVLGVNGLHTGLDFENMLTSTKVALNQGGFSYTETNGADLKPYKVVIAVGHQVVSDQEAAHIDAFVQAGGTFIFTPRFASQTTLGVTMKAYPGGALANWDLAATPGKATTSGMFRLDGVAKALAGFQMTGQPAFIDQMRQQGWQVLATHLDNTPAILSRQMGKGRVIFLNAVYQSHWYIQWVTPTDANRQGFYKLIETLCTNAGARRSLRLNGNMVETLQMAVKQYSDPSGQIQYAVVRTSGEVPWVNGSLSWLGSQTACYDVLNGKVGAPTPRYGKEIALNMQPGTGKLLAFVQRPIAQIQVTAQPAHIMTGQPLQLVLRVLDANRKPVAGKFPLEVRVWRGDTEIAGLHRSVSLADGEMLLLNTALSDPAGSWTITATDGISGLSGSINVQAIHAPANAPGNVPWGWPSEINEPATLTAADFVGRLRRLTDLYNRDFSNAKWMAKQYLGYYYDEFPGTRHDILRALEPLDWTAYAGDLRKAVTDGGRFILTGEDLGVDPQTGLTTYPTGDGNRLTAVWTALAGATWTTATSDGDTLIAKLGAGQVILSRESIDAAGYSNPDMIAWQQRWQRELKRGETTPITIANLTALQYWWLGTRALAPMRTARWFDNNAAQQKIELKADDPYGTVVTLLVPPTGTLTETSLTCQATGTGTVHFDVGCDGKLDGDLPAGSATPTALNWTKPAAQYLTWCNTAQNGPYRSGNNWRLLPVRLTASGNVTVTLDNVVCAAK